METKPTQEQPIQVTRTVHVKVYQCDGCWWARLYERLDPPTYPGGGPRTGNNIMFSSVTADGAKQKALDFIRGAAEALRGGMS